MILLFVFLLAYCFVYIEYIGTPKWIKILIEDKLKSDNVELHFTDIRLDWLKGIVVNRISFKLIYGNEVIPTINADSAEIIPSINILLNKEFKIKKLIINNATITLNPNTNNNPVIIDNIYAVVRLKPRTLNIHNITGTFNNIKIKANWIIDNITTEKQYEGKKQTDKLLAKYSRIIYDYLNSLMDYKCSTNVELSLNIRSDITSSSHSVTATFQANVVSNKNIIIKDISINKAYIVYTNSTTTIKGILNSGEVNIYSNVFRNITTDFDVVIKSNIISKVNIGDIEIGSVNGLFGSVEKINGRIVFDNILSESITSSKNNLMTTLNARKYNRGDTKLTGLNVKAKFPLILLYGSNALVELSIDCASIDSKLYFANRVVADYNGEVNIKENILKGQVNLICNSLNRSNIIVKYINYNGEVKYETNRNPDIVSGNLNIGELDIDKYKFRNIGIFIDDKNQNQKETKLFTNNNLINYIVNNNCIFKLNLDGLNNFNITNGTVYGSVSNNTIKVEKMNLFTESGPVFSYIEYNLTNGHIRASINSLINPSDYFNFIREYITNSLKNVKFKKNPEIQIVVEGNIENINHILENKYKQLLDRLYITGSFKITNVTVGNINVDKIYSTFYRSKKEIHFKDINVISGENLISGGLEINEKDKRYNAKVSGYVNLKGIFDIYDGKNNDILNLIKVNQPIELDCEISGSLKKVSDAIISSRISATNIIFRGVPIKELRCRVEWSSNVLSFSSIELVRTNEQATGDLIVADFSKKRVYLKNVWGNITPSDLTEAIGSDVKEALKPVSFSMAPNVRANGSVPMFGSIGDIRFDIYAPELSWWKVKPRNVSCTVYWKGETMLITNYNSDFYGGNLKLTLYADFNENNKSNLFFDVNLTDVSSRALLKDILQKPKNIEGRLSGRLTIKSESIDDYWKWTGSGNAVLEDGLIWDIPIFGIFSPILNMISPGLGNSRANYASASFIVTNGAVFSDDLVIRSRALKMQYKGSVDFNKKVDARVEAEVLSDIWLVGTAIKFLLKPLTKLFIYKVSGTIDEPITDPIYIPKILLAPFQPFKTIKSYIFPKPQPEENDSKNQSSRPENSHNRITPLPNGDKN
ncbi:MAG: AsmA-like C-terminal region-containing protein [Verrucomicrobiia bacterium]